MRTYNQINIHRSEDHCGSAFDPGVSGLPYYCAPPVCVPAVLGALAVWRLSTKINKYQSPIFCSSLTSPPPPHSSIHIRNTPSFSPLAGSLKLGSSVSNATIFFLSEGSHDIHSAAVHAREWTPVGTGLSMPLDGAIKCQANAGRAAKETHGTQVPSQQIVP